MSRSCLVAGFILAASSLPAQSSVRDSSGVRIVTHARTARPAATWRIAPQPIVEIGGADGSGPTMFSRIWSVARANSGEIVVTDEPTQELRVFDANGKHLRTFGGRGDGPGEFSQIRDVAIYGDTVYPIDTRRSTAFTLAGKLIRQVPFPPLDGYHPVDPWGALADGSVIHTAAGRETAEIRRQVGTRIEMRALMRIDASGRSFKTLGIVPTFEFFRREQDPPGGDLVAFSPFMMVAVFPDRVCTGRGARYEVQCMNPDGQYNLIIRRDLAPQPLTAAAREAYLKRVRTPVRLPGPEGAPLPQARLDQIAAQTHFADNFPAFDGLMAGSNGELWVGDHDADARTRVYGEQAPESATITWNVFAKDGAWLASVALPARFYPRRAGRDYVLGINRDDDGVERVTMYRLIR